MHSSKILYAELKYCDINKVIDQVREYDIQQNVMYISFNKSYCDKIVQQGLGDFVLYLNGDLSPQEAPNMKVMVELVITNQSLMRILNG